MASSELKRNLSLPLITFYGLGNILGAGIYVLVGKVAGAAGIYAPIAFVVASIIAAITAFCYAELSSRYPLSAGEAVYLHEGFDKRWLSVGAGLMICLAAIISAATITRGFVGYLQVFINIPESVAIIGIALIISGIAMLGVKHAVGTAALLTLVEIAGLLLIVYTGGEHILTASIHPADLIPSTDPIIWSGIFAGAFLAFYAYLGFEDMVNVAEEVKNPERNMPRAIFIALILASTFYMAVTWVAINVVSVDALSRSSSPLSLVYETATGQPPVAITLISLFAIINGALIQIIMVSRILYGMSKQGWLPVYFAHINAHTHTPARNTFLTGLLVMSFALFLPLIALAKITSFLLLIVFSLVNLSLYFIKRKYPDYNGAVNYPLWLPIIGTIASIALIATELL